MKARLNSFTPVLSALSMRSKAGASEVSTYGEKPAAAAGLSARCSPVAAAPRCSLAEALPASPSDATAAVAATNAATAGLGLRLVREECAPAWFVIFGPPRSVGGSCADEQQASERDSGNSLVTGGSRETLGRA